MAGASPRAGQTQVGAAVVVLRHLDTVPYHGTAERPGPEEGVAQLAGGVRGCGKRAGADPSAEAHRGRWYVHPGCCREVGLLPRPLAVGLGQLPHQLVVGNHFPNGRVTCHKSGGVESYRKKKLM